MEWYYADAAEQQHTVQEEQLPELVANGTIQRNTLVWNESMSDWKPAGEVRPDLFEGTAAGPALSPAAPPSSPAAATVQPGPPPQRAPTDSLAVASLVCGILAFFCLGALTGIPAVICGHMARKRAAQETLPSSNAGLALAGLITGYLGIVWGVLYAIFMVMGAVSGEFN